MRRRVVGGVTLHRRHLGERQRLVAAAVVSGEPGGKHPSRSCPLAPANQQHMHVPASGRETDKPDVKQVSSSNPEASENRKDAAGTGEAPLPTHAHASQTLPFVPEISHAAIPPLPLHSRNPNVTPKL